MPLFLVVEDAERIWDDGLKCATQARAALASEGSADLKEAAAFCKQVYTDLTGLPGLSAPALAFRQTVDALGCALIGFTAAFGLEARFRAYELRTPTGPMLEAHRALCLGAVDEFETRLQAWHDAGLEAGAETRRAA